jgi:hypothetical protein
MYRVEFYCPRTGIMDWQPLRDNPFWFLSSATRRADSLIWEVHAARVLDRNGQVVYQL